MEKLLLCASTASHIKNFHLPYIKALTEKNIAVYTASADNALFDGCAGWFELPFKKSMLSASNLAAIMEARRLLLRERFDAVSLHTTLASAVLRAALLTLPEARRPRVLYICHGYLFNDGDGLSALKYLIPEKLCAPVTDILLTMNEEDFMIAQKHRLHGGRLAFINGIGLPQGKIPEDSFCCREQARREMGFGDEDKLFVCVAELSERKNQAELIKAFARALPALPRGYLLFAGDGALSGRLKQLCDSLSVTERVRFLGHVSDIPRLLAAADIYLSASRIEGLPFSVMEAMQAGLPAALSDIKGHRELAKCGDGALLFSFGEELSEALKSLYGKAPCRCCYNLDSYYLEAVMPAVMDAYFEVIKTETERAGAAV